MDVEQFSLEEIMDITNDLANRLDIEKNQSAVYNDLVKHIEKKYSALLLVMVSSICHLMSFFLFQFKYTTLAASLYWNKEFYVLLIISLLSSILLVFLRSNKSIILIILFHSIIFLIIGYPLGDYIIIELILLTVLIFEIAIYVMFPYNILYSAVISGVTLFLQRSVSAWVMDLASASAHDLVFLGLYSFILIIVSSFIKFLIDKVSSQNKTIDRLDEAVMQLNNANIGFQNYANIIEEESTINERNRITREIHDSVGYTLTNLMMMMEVAMRLAPKDCIELRKLHQQAREHAQQGLMETRFALRLLRSVELKRTRGIRAIQKIVKSFEKATGVNVDMNITNVPWSFGDRIDPVIYRIVQEGMTNAFKHGKATRVKIHFFQDDSKIIINIEDNGSGCAEIKKGIGLSGMEERIEELRGNVSARNAINGFMLTVRIPRGLEV